MRCKLVMPAPGHVQAAVFRVWDDDGARVAWLREYDAATETWSARLPLPARPRKALAEAVADARVFVKTGEVR